MSKNYYSLVTVGDVATLNIYGDITSMPWLDGDVSASNLAKQLDDIQSVKEIDVFINSYGGEVAEGLAIYNALKRKCKNTKVVTYCDGFACSIASVIFMAGAERKMSKSSLLMIHNAWTCGCGNAEDLRKVADDLEVITSASVEAYKDVSTLSEKKIRELMDAESWITPKDAKKYGFATEIVDENTENPSQSVKSTLYDLILSAKGGKLTDFEQKEGKDTTDKENGVNEPQNSEKDDNPAEKCKKDDEKQAETKRWKCKECDYIYEGEELPDDFVCPECGSTEFELIDDDETADEKTETTANEKLSGFFNAILKI